MTVHDCIKEYKEMGERVFGHPRPPGLGPIPTPWYKFDARNLASVIHDVSQHYGEVSNGDTQYRAPEELCKT
jgi:hypothetical protein